MQVSLSGAELFLYNRTPSYDAILEQLGLQEQNPLRRGPSEPSSTSSPSSSLDKKEKESTPSSPRPSTAASSIEQVQAEQGEKERARRKRVAEGKRDGTNWLLEALPIAVTCSRGAIIMGNPSTPTILIAGFDGVEGTYSAGKARSRLDDYKEVYHFVFRRPKIVWRTNPDFKAGMADYGQTLMQRLDAEMRVFCFPFPGPSFNPDSSCLSPAAATSLSRASLPARRRSSLSVAFATSCRADLAHLVASDDGLRRRERRQRTTRVTSTRPRRQADGRAYLDTSRRRTMRVQPRTPSCRTASSTPKWPRCSSRKKST